MDQGLRKRSKIGAMLMVKHGTDTCAAAHRCEVDKGR